MTDGDFADDTPQSERSVGDRLRAAREAQNLDVADIAQRTRIPQRHLEAIETGNYSALPSITYAMGFARAYARTVGVDEVSLATDLRTELDHSYAPKRREIVFEEADPRRVPTAGLALAGVAVAIVLLIGVFLWYGTSLFRTEDAPPVVAETVAPTPVVPAPAAPTGAGQVVLTATDEVWVRVYDAAGTTLLMKTMQPGETYSVPLDANGPQLNVGRPDQLTVTIDGTAVAPLGDGSRAISDVAIDAAALRARGAPAPAAPPVAG